MIKRFNHARRFVEPHRRRAAAAAPAADLPLVPGDRRPPRRLTQHREDACDVRLREAPGVVARRGRGAGRRPGPAGAVPGPRPRPARARRLTVPGATPRRARRRCRRPRGSRADGHDAEGRPAGGWPTVDAAECRVSPPGALRHRCPRPTSIPPEVRRLRLARGGWTFVRSVRRVRPRPAGGRVVVAQ